MKKIITTIAVTAISISMSLTAYAADMLDKNYIESEIWEDIWLGKSDNGTEFPEASFKHHLLDEWITQNYGSDDFDWSELGELKYQYKRYYENYIAGWDFNDDDNGNWTIDTEEHSYHFQLINHTWNMIDENGDTVDTFPPFSTEELQAIQHMESLVSGLVGCGWGYEQIKEFIQENNTAMQIVA